MDEHQHWHRRKLMEKAAGGLEKNGFEVVLFETGREALAHLRREAAQVANVGIGGSMTLMETGVVEALEQDGKEVLSHGRPGLRPEERLDLMRRQSNCDLFLTSTNALTVGGHLVNIDASGNRVGAMAFGPGKVIVVAGSNKITMDLEGALKRVKEIACPPNARRLGFDTPCAHTGLCSDCDSPQRICRITTIIEKRPRLTEMQVCLVNEDLGY